jgi:hypothetical protein
VKRRLVRALLQSLTGSAFAARARAPGSA